jgi:hypothetical protein
MHLSHIGDEGHYSMADRGLSATEIDASGYAFCLQKLTKMAEETTVYPRNALQFTKVPVT